MVIVGIIVVIAIILYKKSKVKMYIPVGALTFVDGAVKSGKTSFTLTLARREYKRTLCIYYVRRFFQKLLHKTVDEKPLFYSNIPVKFKYVKVTEDILKRKKRIAYKSVVFLSEASLVADNMLYKDIEANNRIMLFAKLFGHYSKGGKLFIESQSIGDIAVAIRRCISAKYYIDHSINIPFFRIMYLRYERYTEDGTAVNTYEDDNEFTKYLVSKRIFKKFDSYCYSALTDNLKAEKKVIEATSLKCNEIFTFDRNIKEVINEKEDNK